MLVIVGSIIVAASVMGGFIWAGGPPLVLLQPSEFLVIGGAGSIVVCMSDSRVRTMAEVGHAFSKKGG